MSYPFVLKEKGIQDITTVDIREDSKADIKANYLSWSPPKEFDLIITNPPFALAEKVISKSLAIVKQNGFVVMLLRLNFFGSAGRFPFWTQNPAKYAFVHHKRMSFTPDGKTDSIEYMHAVWQKGYKGMTQLKVL